MSILIKDMEMPKHCGECGIEWCEKWKRLIIGGMSIAKTRPSDCPLIEVPPHGRLIDAEELFWKVYDYFGEDCETAENWMMRVINEAPTVIPSDKEEE